MKFAVFILTHGRPDRVQTITSMRRAGYTGRIFLVVDDEDPTLPQYLETFGDDVIVFSKEEAAKRFDVGDNFTERRAVVFARNEMWRIAKEAGYRFHIVVDDDYTSWSYRRDDKFMDTGVSIRGGLDRLFASTFDCLRSTGFDCIAWSQGGDHIGGVKGPMKFRRKIMNSFFMDAEKPFPFLGRINEDTTTYCVEGLKGKLFGTVMYLQLNQAATQSNAGGLTDIYLSFGTYVKSFYSVMYCPAFVSVSVMGEVEMRLHHRVKWNSAAPKIIREEYRLG